MARAYDLFGNESPEPELNARGKPKRKPTLARGYAAPPGTGPAGETCGSCAHATYKPRASSRRFWKCGLVKPTNGLGTDIRLKSPACRRWSKP